MSRPHLPDEYALLQQTVEQFAHDVVAPVIAKHYEARSFPYEIVAGMAGVARENASRAINDLLRDGILARDGSFYVIARPGELEDMAEI